MMRGRITESGWTDESYLIARRVLMTHPKISISRGGELGDRFGVNLTTGCGPKRNDGPSAICGLTASLVPTRRGAASEGHKLGPTDSGHSHMISNPTQPVSLPLHRKYTQKFRASRLLDDRPQPTPNPRPPPSQDPGILTSTRCVIPIARGSSRRRNYHGLPELKPVLLTQPLSQSPR